MTQTLVAHDHLTRAQAAAKLQVSEQTVDNYIKQGKLKATKLGKKGTRSPVRICASSVERLLGMI